MGVLTIDPASVSVPKLHGYMLGAVAPRPIAFASTVNADGVVNLSPYSFFNCFGANPPTMIFSPARRVRDNTTKHTLENVKVNGEVVINIVSHSIVEQMSLSSTEYPEGVNEFVKAGLTEVPSQKVAPPRVGEAPAAFECRVQQIVATGTEGGAGNLIICEVLLVHIQESILGEDGRIDPFKLDAVGRLGGDWYVRCQGNALFEVAKPLRNLGIGVDAMPQGIRQSEVLTGNDLGRLGNVEQLPGPAVQEAVAALPEVMEAMQRFAHHKESLVYHLHELAQGLVRDGQLEKAWALLLLAEGNPG